MNQPVNTREPPTTDTGTVPAVSTSYGVPRLGGILRVRLEPYALLFLLGAVAVFFSIYPSTSETFPTLANVQVIIGNQSVLAIIALGVLIPLVCEEFDLSVGAVAGTSAVFVASAMSNGLAVPLALLLALGIGLAVGIINALLVTKARVTSLIGTLGTATILAGLIVWKTGGVAVVTNIPASVVSFGSGNTLGIPRTGFALVAAALGVYYVLEHTPVGRYVYAIGSNREAARLVGIPVEGSLIFAFVASGALAGVAGFLQVARAGGADPRVGEGFTLPALAAAFLSAAAIKPGTYNVGGALVAIFFLAVLNSGLNLAGVPGYVNSVVNGVALIIGVALAAFFGRRRAR